MTATSANHNWGLVLSGGGACGLANIGVLQVLEANDLHPRCISGSSMGAIVGALYALGHPVSVLLDLARALHPVSVVRPSASPLRGGLHGGLLSQALEDHLGPLVGDARIGECRTPFVCVAGRVRCPIRWERMLLPGFTEHVLECIDLHVFGPDVRVIDAVRASSAVPVLFSPTEIDGEQFVDLLHFGAIPARTLRERYAPRVLVATDTQPGLEGLEPWLPASVRELVTAGKDEVEQSLAVCDLVIRPRLTESPLRFDLGLRFARFGREAAESRIPEIRALIAG